MAHLSKELIRKSDGNLLDNVLIVKKTPKYERLKDSEFIKHPYIQENLLKNWIEANTVHFRVADKVEAAIKSKANRVKVTQEWPLTEEDCLGKSLIVSLGGDGTFLRTASRMFDPTTPLLGINTDPQRSVGELCGKFVYKDKVSPAEIDQIFLDLEAEKWDWDYR